MIGGGEERGRGYDDLRVIDIGSATRDGIDAVGEVDDLGITFHQGRGFAVRSDVEDGAGGSGHGEECGGEGEGFHV